MKIIVETDVAAPVEAVWRAFNNPDDIVQCDGSDDWHTTRASNDLKVGGLLELRIEDKGGGVGFDFAAAYTRVEPNRLIEWRMDDNRIVRVEFLKTSTGVTVRQTFEAQSMGSSEQERLEWQAVLDSFTRHVSAIQSK